MEQMFLEKQKILEDLKKLQQQNELEDSVIEIKIDSLRASPISKKHQSALRSISVQSIKSLFQEEDICQETIELKETKETREFKDSQTANSMMNFDEDQEMEITPSKKKFL